MGLKPILASWIYRQGEPKLCMILEKIKIHSADTYLKGNDSPLKSDCNSFISCMTRESFLIGAGIAFTATLNGCIKHTLIIQYC